MTTKITITLGSLTQAVLETDRRELNEERGLTSVDGRFTATTEAWTALAEELETMGGGRGLHQEGWDLDAGAKRACRATARKIRKLVGRSAK